MEPISVTEIGDDMLLVELSSSNLSGDDGDMDEGATTAPKVCIPFRRAQPAAALSVSGAVDERKIIDCLLQRQALLEKDMCSLSDTLKELNELVVLSGAVDEQKIMDDLAHRQLLLEKSVCSLNTVVALTVCTKLAALRLNVQTVNSRLTQHLEEEKEGGEPEGGSGEKKAGKMRLARQCCALM